MSLLSVATWGLWLPRTPLRRCLQLCRAFFVAGEGVPRREPANRLGRAPGERRPLTSALVIMPHPDDADFGAGGTVASWIDDGITVSYLVATEGDAGVDSNNREMEPNRAQADAGSPVQARRTEQEQAARVLGLSSVEFLQYPDARVQATVELRCHLANAIRRVRPERVLAPTPVWNLSVPSACHPDHLAVGAAACFAVLLDARNRNAPPELADPTLPPHEVSELWLMSDAEPNCAVDISAHLDTKRQAVSAHMSQLTDLDEWWTNMRRWASECAQKWEMPPGKFAEEFRVIRID